MQLRNLLQFQRCPGAQVSFAHLGFCFTAHAIECSRPPPPNISICKKVSLAL